MNGEGKDFIRWMEKGKTLINRWSQRRDRWRRKRLYETNGEEKNFIRQMELGRTLEDKWSQEGY